MSRVEDRLYSRDKGNDNSIDVRPFLASDFFVGDFPIMNHKHGVLFMSRILRRAPIVLILLLIALAGSADADWQKVASIGTSSGPYSVAVDGTNAYVTCFNSNTLEIIDLNTYARTSVATGPGPYSVAVDGTNAYVTCRLSNTLDIINLDTHARTSYATGSGPFGVAVDGTNAYVTCRLLQHAGHNKPEHSCPDQLCHRLRAIWCGGGRHKCLCDLSVIQHV